MSMNGGDPRTYKKVSDESHSSVGPAPTTSSTTPNLSNTSSYTTQTTSSTSYTFSSSDITSKPETFNRSANDRGSSC